MLNKSGNTLLQFTALPGFTIEKNATFKFPVRLIFLILFDPVVKLNER